MVVCSYYQQGRCKFGDRCKYEHPGSQSAFGTGNRFGVLGGGGGGGGGPGAGAAGRGGGSLASRVTGPGGGQDPREKYALKAVDIKNDLTAGEGRPLWIFSAYGPGKNAPVQLFGGTDREQSPEEMRALHYAAVTAGNPQQAIQDANNLYAATEAQIQTILNDTEGAIKYVIDGENQHPNRNDVAAGNSGQEPTFGQQPGGQQAQTPAFGQPSSLLGQQGQGTGGAPAFGQPSALGQQREQHPQPGFGQPAFGQTSHQPAFGQPSTLGGQQPAFGKPSALGTAQPAFGQPSAMGTSPFGQQAPSQGSTQPNPFGAAQSASPFGQAASQTQQSPFSQLPSQQPPPDQTQRPSPFSQVGQQQATQPSPFGQQQTPSAQPSGFPAATSAPFGEPSAPTLGASTLGQTQQQPQPQPQQQPQETTTTSSTRVPHKDPTSLNPLPNLSGETRREPPNNNLAMWKGRPVKYIDDAPCYSHPDDWETFVRIYFPDGPPGAENFKHSVGKPEDYTADIEEAYRYVKEHGAFKDGIIPSVPPKPEWCSFDF